MTMSLEEVESQYSSLLGDLKMNSKPMINVLTMLAEDFSEKAEQSLIVVQTIEKHLNSVPPNIKLPALYLIDSIVKNVRKEYPKLFTQNIVSSFCGVFEKVKVKSADDKVKQQLFKLRQTWNDVFPQRKLYAIDVRCHNADKNWPICDPPRSSSSIQSIHVNPKFLNKPPSSTTSASSPSSIADSDISTDITIPADVEEATMRATLLHKKKELLELQAKKIELELQQTQAAIESKRKEEIESVINKEKLLLNQAEMAKNKTQAAHQILSKTASSKPSSISQASAPILMRAEHSSIPQSSTPVQMKPDSSPKSPKKSAPMIHLKTEVSPNSPKKLDLAPPKPDISPKSQKKAGRSKEKDKHSSRKDKKESKERNGYKDKRSPNKSSSSSKEDERDSFDSRPFAPHKRNHKKSTGMEEEETKDRRSPTKISYGKLDERDIFDPRQFAANKRNHKKSTGMEMEERKDRHSPNKSSSNKVVEKERDNFDVRQSALLKRNYRKTTVIELEDEERNDKRSSSKEDERDTFDVRQSAVLKRNYRKNTEIDVEEEEEESKERHSPNKSSSNKDEERDSFDARQSAVLKRNYRKTTGIEVEETSDVDLRFQGDVDLRKETDDRAEPAVKKPRSNNNIIDDLFGHEDVDLRAPPRRSDSWSQVKMSEKQPPEEMQEIIYQQNRNRQQPPSISPWNPGFQPRGSNDPRAMQRFNGPSGPRQPGGGWGHGPRPGMNVDQWNPQFQHQQQSLLPRPSGPNPFVAALVEDTIQPWPWQNHNMEIDDSNMDGGAFRNRGRGRGGRGRRGRGRGGHMEHQQMMSNPMDMRDMPNFGRVPMHPEERMRLHRPDEPFNPYENEFREISHQQESPPNNELPDVSNLLALAAQLGMLPSEMPKNEPKEKKDEKENIPVAVNPVVAKQKEQRIKFSMPALPTVEVLLVSEEKDYSKKRREILIDQLWTGVQCAICGLRFPPDQSVRYSQHLDWHFRRNRREKSNSKKAQSRSWYYDLADWIQFEEVEDLEERAASLFEIQEEADGESKSPHTPINTEEHTVMAAGHEGASCPQCGEPFEGYYDEDKEEWRLRDAILDQVEGDIKVYHFLCHQDYHKSMVEEIIKDKVEESVVVDMQNPETTETTELEEPNAKELELEEEEDDDDEVLILKEGKKEVVLMEIDVDDEDGLNETTHEIIEKNKEAENGPDFTKESKNTESSDDDAADKYVPNYSVIARPVSSPILINDDSSSNLLPGISEDSMGGVFSVVLDRIRSETPEPVEEKRIVYKSMEFEFPKIKLEPLDPEEVPEEEVPIPDVMLNPEPSAEDVENTLRDATSQDPIDLTADDDDDENMDVCDGVTRHPQTSIDGNLQQDDSAPILFVPQKKMQINITGISKSPSTKDELQPLEQPVGASSPSQIGTSSPLLSDNSDNSNAEIVFTDELKRLKPRLATAKLKNFPPKRGRSEESGLCVIC